MMFEEVYLFKLAPTLTINELISLSNEKLADKLKEIFAKLKATRNRIKLLRTYELKLFRQAVFSLPSKLKGAKLTPCELCADKPPSGNFPALTDEQEFAQARVLIWLDEAERTCPKPREESRQSGKVAERG